MAGTVLLGVLLPALWIVGAWSLGPRLDHVGVPFLTPLLFVVVLVGLAASAAAAARWIAAIDARLAGRTGQERTFRLRMPTRLRAPVPVLDEPSRPELPPSRRLVAVGLAAFMAAGSVALVVGAPLGSIWVVSQLARTTQPEMGPYLLVALATTVCMVLGVRALLRLQLAYARVIKAPARRRRRTAWLTSHADERGVRRAERGLETVLVAVVIVAGLALCAWFFALDDPSGLVSEAVRQQ